MERFFAVIVGCRARLATNFCLSYPVPLVWNDKRREGRENKGMPAIFYPPCFCNLFLLFISFIYVSVYFLRQLCRPQTALTTMRSIPEEDKPLRIQPQVNCPQIAPPASTLFRNEIGKKGFFAVFPASNRWLFTARLVRQKKS